MNKFSDNREVGQSLIEIIVSLALAGFLIVGAITAISASLKSDIEGQAFQVGSYLSQELAINVAAFSKANWRNIYNLSRVPDVFRLNSAGEGFGVIGGSEIFSLNNTSFTRYFTIASTSRDADSNLETSYQSAGEDPSTLKLVVTTTWVTSNGGLATSSISRYVTRHRDYVFSQTDWSGGIISPVEIVPLPNNSYLSFFSSINVATSTVGEIYIDGL